MLVTVGVASYFPRFVESTVLYITDGIKAYVFGVSNDEGMGFKPYSTLLNSNPALPAMDLFNCHPLAQLKADQVHDAFRVLEQVSVGSSIWGWGQQDYVRDLLRALTVNRLVYYNGVEIVEHALLLMISR